MRPILAVTILLVGLSRVAPDPKLPPSFADDFQTSDSGVVPFLIKTDASIGGSDRSATAAPSSFRNADDGRHAGIAERLLALASASASVDADVVVDAASGGTPSHRVSEVSLDQICNALAASAQDNDLPIPFFANLIWQESRLHDDAVSAKGALGIAQFMPEVAVENHLGNPFDPMEAIPASARFLHELRLQFGNLGFVAAAYNAGARRVAEWLEHRGSLPRETRNYVVRVTGLSVDAWRSIPVNSEALTFVQHLPCRSLPTFVNVEQAQLEETERAAANRVQRRSFAAEASATDPGFIHAASPRAQIDIFRHQKAKAHRVDLNRRATKGKAAHDLRARDRRRSA